MSPSPPPGAFPHQHHDPRGLVERIEAQLRERIVEAVELAGLKLMVDLRQRQGRPAPETSSEADRSDFEQTAVALLSHVGSAFRDELAAEERRRRLVLRHTRQSGHGFSILGVTHRVDEL